MSWWSGLRCSPRVGRAQGELSKIGENRETENEGVFGRFFVIHIIDGLL